MDDTKFCPSCGDQVPVTTKYCDNCGYAFPKETIPQASVYTPPVMNVQPEVNNTPVPEVNTAPVVNEQPVVNNATVAATSPVENSQPVINNTQETVKPVVDTAPAHSPEPMVNDVQEEKVQLEVSNNTQDTLPQPTVDNAPKADAPVVDSKADNVSESSVAPAVNNSQTVVEQPASKSAAENTNVSSVEQQPAVTVAASMAGMPGSQVPTSQMNSQQMQGNQFGAQIPNGQANRPQTTGPQSYGPQMNSQQPGGPVLMNPAYATAVPPEKPKGHGCLIAVLVAIMIAVIVIALIACGILATQLEGVDDLFSDAGISGSIGGKHSIVLSDTETVYMEVGDTHTITVENIDDFFSPRDIDWSVAGGGYYSNDVIRIDDNYDGSVTVTALNPGKTSVIVSGRNVDKEEGYVVKIDVSEKSLEYGDVLSGGEFSFEGTAWETSWGSYYFVGPQAGSVEINQFEADRGMPISSSETACMMISDYYSDYAYGSVECRKVTENDIYSSMYYNDVAAYLDDGAEIYWFTYQPEIECIYGSQSFGNEYDVLFIFEPSGDVYVYDSGLAMTGDAKDNASWLTYDEIDERFSSY